MTSVALGLRGLAVGAAVVLSWAGPALAAAPSPAPADAVRTPEPGLVTPGTIGFLVTFGVAVALVLLVRDMVRRNRGLVVRAERRDAELRDAELRDAELRDAELRDAELREAEGRGPGPAGSGVGSSGAAAGAHEAATRPGPPSRPGERPGPGGQGPAAPTG